MLAALGLAACGGSPASSPASPSATGAHTPTATPSTSATPTAPPAPLLIVWVVDSSSGRIVRVAPATGGAFHTVATIPLDAEPLGAGGQTLLASFPDGHLRGINLSSGATTDFGGATNHAFFGAAFSPDGTHAAYIEAATPTSAALKVLDIASGTSTTLRTFTADRYDVPQVWNSGAMGGNQVVGFSDAGPQGYIRLDPATGSRTANTDTADAGGVVAEDASHVSDAFHSSLGDDADYSGAPGPQGPFNTLRTFTIGGSPSNALQEAHHNISVLAVSADGSTTVFFDDSAAGGFAGISMSPDFGLMTWSGGHKTQLEKYGDRWDAAAFVSPAVFVAAKHSGSSESLVKVDGTSLTALDSQTGETSHVFLTGPQPTGVSG